MAGRGVDRQRWVVDTLAVRPAGRLLEIGCGGGTATALVAERLTTGTILAVDRAASAVRQTRERNAAHVAAGTVEVRQADIAATELPEGSFDTVFAVNVSLFWLATPPGLLDRIGRLLAPGGTLHVFAERPAHAAVEAIAAQVADALRTSGFHPVGATVRDTRAAVVGGSPGEGVWSPH
ncbi:class I SAM-dependent methyltransferase [Phytohabitans sp. LJ34]|uniref:class I SAM-dependent methyltransferase n=1 Tax=Phytohabitans sp. LJ34 TaxID=3452217 RepID=UPI003F8B9BCD